MRTENPFLMDSTILSYILICGLTVLRTSVCEIHTDLMMSIKDRSLGNVVSNCQKSTAIACIIECEAYEPRCRAASYMKSDGRCLLHSMHPLSPSAQLTLSSGFRLYYSEQEECDVGWEKFGGSCYLFNTNPLSWVQAKITCTDLGSNFLKIEDAAENEFARGKCAEYGGHHYWIGVRYSAQYGEYRWYDDTAISYNGWYPGEPDTTNGCMDMLDKFDWNWNDHGDCFSTYGGSICEKVGALTGLGTVVCEIRTDLVISIKDRSLGDVVSSCHKSTAIACINECVTYEPRCRAASYTKSDGRCLLHFTHPLSSNAQLTFSSGFRLYYSEQGECDGGWEKFGGNCYLFNTNPLSWVQAKTACTYLGSNLLKVEDAAENEFVRTKCAEYGANYYWIGARYSAQYGEYRWYDGTAISYNFWNQGEPNTINGCVDMLDIFGYTWNDHWDCFATYGGSICEKDRNFRHEGNCFGAERRLAEFRAKTVTRVPEIPICNYNQ